MRASTRAASASEPAPWPSPAVTIDGGGDALSAGAGDDPGTVAGGVATTMRSGTGVRSSIRATQGSPSISRYFGLTSRIGPGKSRLPQIPQHGPPERALARARADERDRARREELVEAVGGHETVFS